MGLTLADRIAASSLQGLVGLGIGVSQFLRS